MQDHRAHLNEEAHAEGSQHIVESFKADTILVAEFEYIAQTAFQANEDRARVTNFYLVAVGSLVAAILSTQAESLRDTYAYWGFAALFGVLTLAGVLTLLQLARLRQAWFDSASAMNRIKEFYIQQLHEAKLEEAFLWRMSTLPARLSPWSISSLLATQVSLLGGVTLGAATVFAGLACGRWWWEYAIAAGVIASALQIVLYTGGSCASKCVAGWYSTRHEDGAWSMDFSPLPVQILRFQAKVDSIGSAVSLDASSLTKRRGAHRGCLQ